MTFAGEIMDISVSKAIVWITPRYSDMPHGTDRPYPIRILAFFEMIRPYHVGIRISGSLREENCKACV